MKKICSLLLVLFCCACHNRAEAQAIDLIGDLVFDGGICTPGDTTHITGTISNSQSCTAPYYFQCNFGDGTVDTIPFMGCAYYSLFRLAHKYTAAGAYTLTLRSMDSLYHVTDTIQTAVNIGNCQKATGFYFFDCNQNCTVDSFEQPARSRTVNFSKNSVVKPVYLDATGKFSIPVYAGDSYVPLDQGFPGMEIRTGCWQTG